MRFEPTDLGREAECGTTMEAAAADGGMRLLIENFFNYVLLLALVRRRKEGAERESETAGGL